eukprot:gene17448-6979_t
MLVPEGVWTCPPMNLTSHLTVWLVVDSPTPGHDHPGPRWAPFLNGYDVVNLTIGGENGTIDGDGSYWWTRKLLGLEKHTRPTLWEC